MGNYFSRVGRRSGGVSWRGKKRKKQGDNFYKVPRRKQTNKKTITKVRQVENGANWLPRIIVIKFSSYSALLVRQVSTTKANLRWYENTTKAKSKMV